MFAKTAAFVLVATFAATAMAAEFEKGTLKSISGTSVVGVNDRCTTDAKFLGVFPYKKTIDCYGIILKDVVVENNSGTQLQLGAVTIYPAAFSRADAEEVADDIVLALKGPLPEGMTITLSELRYISDESSLMAVTANQADEARLVLVGGLTIDETLVQKNGSLTATHSRHLNIGIE